MWLSAWIEVVLYMFPLYRVSHPWQSIKSQKNWRGVLTAEIRPSNLHRYPHRYPHLIHLRDHRLIINFSIDFSHTHTKTQIQDANPNSGLLQSAIITLYTMYLTWSAMSNNPVKECNPDWMGLANSTAAPPTDDTVKHPSLDAQSIIGLCIWMVCVLYSTIRNSSHTSVGRCVLILNLLISSNETWPADRLTWL